MGLFYNQSQQQWVQHVALAEARDEAMQALGLQPCTPGRQLLAHSLVQQPASSSN